MSRASLHLSASLANTGFHPAAWRAAAAPAFPIGRRFQTYARIAERGGLDAIWLGPQHFGPAAQATGAVDAIRFDPLPLLGALIAGTQRIGIGAHWGVEHAEPFHVARVFSTLDHLAHGRTAWIVGPPDTGDAGFARAAELVEVARKLWDSWEDEGFLLDVPTGRFADPARVHPIEHAGPFFAVRGPLNVPRPVQGNPPLVMAFPTADAGRRFAASVADVLLIDSTTLEGAMAQRSAIKALRPGGDLRVLVNVMAVLGDSVEGAQRRADALDDMITPALDAALRADGECRMLRFVGTPADLVALFAEWSAASVCDGFNILPAVLPDDLAMLADAVVPLARARGLLPDFYAGTTLREHLRLHRPRSRYAS
jgi:alkanesulfonate monooxygenase SsuD/methylene tetrahydromethanopterin reductase-like flavin-dependent oxidoreductase (luciferase family)